MSTNITSDQEEKTPRLEPIQNPGNLKTKLAYWLTKRKVGKVITPLKVAYARFPESLGLAKTLKNLEAKFTIDKELQFLIQTYVATVNGCAFCVDIGRASLQQKNEDPSKMDELLKFEESSYFSETEKAALAYTDEATRNKHVKDQVFERLKTHFSDAEIVQITMINAIENYYNLINAPLNVDSDELCALWSSQE